MNRIKKLQKKLRKIDCFLVSNPLNLNYLTDANMFSENSRDGFALITKKSAYLFISCLISHGSNNVLAKFISRSFNKIFTLKKTNNLFKLLNSSLLTPLASLNFTTKCRRPLVNRSKFLLGFEKNNLKYFEYQKLSKKIKAKLIPTKNLVENLRLIKDEKEIEKIKKACQITKLAFAFIQNRLKPGKTERQIAWLMEKNLRQNNADSLVYPIIVAFGPNSAVPHHQANNRKLQKNDVVLIDAGCKYQGYCSDITRTFFVGQPKPEWQKVYHIVKSAQQKALKTLNTKYKILNTSTQPLRACQIDEICRDYIKNKGFGKYFIHRTGHGLGLTIHERPNIDKKSQQTLRCGMVFTIEPGIYLPGKFGVRIEDTIVL